MATATIYNHFCKGVTNRNSGTRMTWWKTSFNMPVPAIYDNVSGWTEGTGVMTYHGEATSFSLTGFEAGWEIIGGLTNFNLHGPFTAGNVTCTQTWKNPSGTTLFTNSAVIAFPSLADASFWQEYQLASNQGVAAWEVASAGTYSLVATMVGSGINLTTTFNVTFSNVPSVATYATGKVWVDGNYLCYTSANGHIHKIDGTVNGTTGSASYAGKMWCASGTDDIYWVGSTGSKIYSNTLATDYTKRSLRQFASIFSNGATGAVNAGVGNAGKTWMDSEFGYEHISFIGKNGYKELLYSGNYPYTDPNG